MYVHVMPVAPHTAISPRDLVLAVGFFRPQRVDPSRSIGPLIRACAEVVPLVLFAERAHPGRCAQGKVWSLLMGHVSPAGPSGPNGPVVRSDVSFAADGEMDVRALVLQDVLESAHLRFALSVFGPYKGVGWLSCCGSSSQASTVWGDPAYAWDKLSLWWSPRVMYGPVVDSPVEVHCRSGRLVVLLVDDVSC